MRWNAMVVGVTLVLGATAGCQRDTFLTKDEYAAYIKNNFLPPNIESNPAASDLATVSHMPRPMTVNETERKPRHITLNECLAVALEHGTTGLQSVRALGVSNDDLVTFTGNSVVGSDNIRVFALQPAITQTNIEASLSRFDAQFTASATWTTTDEQQQGLQSFQNGQTAQVIASLVKPLPTGGFAGITFNNTYQNLSNPPTGTFSLLNPSYTSRLSFQFEQPLLLNSGVDINQLLTTQVPSTLFGQLNNRRSALSSPVEGIVITRIRFDQQRAEFERNLNWMTVNVESAYWNLYGAYVSLYAAEQGLRISHTVWQIEKTKYEVGKEDITVFAPTRGLYENFRENRLKALDQVLNNERILRALMGLPTEDGFRLIPVDAPTQAPLEPNWEVAVNEALNLRPELVLARQDLKVRQMNLILQKNFLRPDLRLTASYTPVGLGTRLDGNGVVTDGTGAFRTDNALRSLASDHFNDWQVGMTLNMPLGFRLENAALRQARLLLAQSYAVLKDQEDRAVRSLVLQYRTLFTQHNLIQATREERKAYAQEIDGRFKNIAIGKATPDRFLLQAIQSWSDALNREYQAIVAYNNAIAGFEFTKGTILQHNNIMIAEGPLPAAAQVRATEHERERCRAIVLRQHENPIVYTKGCLEQGGEAFPAIPQMPTESAPPLPSLLDEAPRPPEPPLGTMPGTSQSSVAGPNGAIGTARGGVAGPNGAPGAAPNGIAGPNGVYGSPTTPPQSPPAGTPAMLPGSLPPNSISAPPGLNPRR
jgi:outer membrane protein TolC